MPVVNGQVNIQIKTDAVGNAAPKVKGVGKDVSGVGDAAAGSTPKVRSLGGAVEGLRKGAKPLEDLKGNFDAMKGTIEFATGAAALLTAGILGVIEMTSESAREFTAWRGAMGEATSQVMTQTAELRALETQMWNTRKATNALKSSTFGMVGRLAALEGNEPLVKAAKAAQFREDLRGEVAGAGSRVNASQEEISKALEAVDKTQASIDALQSRSAAGVMGALEFVGGVAGISVDSIRDMNDEQIKKLKALKQVQLDNVQVQKEHATAAWNTFRATEAAVNKTEELLDRGVDVEKLLAERNEDDKDRPRGRPRRDPGLTGRDNARADAAGERAYDEWVRAKADEAKAALEAEVLAAESAGAIKRAQRVMSVRDDATAAGEMAGTIRDLSTAFADGIPQMTAFAGALGSIASSWNDVAAANDNVMRVEAEYRAGKADEIQLSEAIAGARKSEAKAAIDSVGAIAIAGAESIKNERLRAGVLAIIQTGLSIASFATGDLVGGAGHALAAATLGSVAIFGGAKSSSASAAQPRTQQLSTASAQPPSYVTQVNIQGGWYGSASPQETAYAMEQRQRAHAGNGFARAA